MSTKNAQYYIDLERYNVLMEQFYFYMLANKKNLKINSHSLTSRHFQFFVKNIPIKEQADKV